jgi:hypothetical protein
MKSKKHIAVFLLLALLATSAFCQRKNRAPLFRFGIRAGFNMSDLTSAKGLDIWNGLAFYDQNFNYVGLTDTKPFKLGFNVGLTTQIRINENWSWQPSLLLTSKGYKVDAKYTDKNKEYSIKINASAYYFQLPVDFVYKYAISDAFRFVAQGGIFIGFGAFGYTDFEDDYGADTIPRRMHELNTRPYISTIDGEPHLISCDPTVHGAHLYWADRDDTFIPKGTWKFDAGVQIGIGFELKSFALMLQYQYSFTPLYDYDADFTERYEQKDIYGIHNSFEQLGEKNPGSPMQHVISVNLIYFLDFLKTSKTIRW